jgi:hypothetical protein
MDLRERIARGLMKFDGLEPPADDLCGSVLADNNDYHEYFERTDRLLAVPELKAGLSLVDRWMSAGPQERKEIIAEMMEQHKG